MCPGLWEVRACSRPLGLSGPLLLWMKVPGWEGLLWVLLLEALLHAGGELLHESWHKTQKSRGLGWRRGVILDQLTGEMVWGYLAQDQITIHHVQVIFKAIQDVRVIVSSILDVHCRLHLCDKCCNLWLPSVISCIGQNDWTQSRKDESEAFSRQVRGVGERERNSAGGGHVPPVQENESCLLLKTHQVFWLNHFLSIKKNVDVKKGNGGKLLFLQVFHNSVRLSHFRKLQLVKTF